MIGVLQKHLIDGKLELTLEERVNVTATAERKIFYIEG